MFGVVPVGEVAADREKARRTDVETAGLEAAQDLAGELALHRVGLQQDECLLGGHRPRRLLPATY
jgi:hypothetical protein